MINYLVDASMYALPKVVPEILDEELLQLYEEYIKTLDKLINNYLVPNEYSIKYDFLRINRFMFSRNDLLLIEKMNLFLDRPNKAKLEKIIKDNNIKVIIHSLYETFINIICDPRSKSNSSKNNPKPGRFRFFEDYMDFCNTDIELNNLSEIFNKNLQLLAFINKCIYKTSDEITGIISNKLETEYFINLETDKVKHQFNNMDVKIDISRILVRNYNIYNVVIGELKSLNDILDIINSEKFESTLIFDYYNIKISIDDYEKHISMLAEEINNKVNKDLKYYKTEYSNSVYNCLCILDILVKYKQNTNVIISNKYDGCEKWIINNDICKKCCGYLRICGFDCSGENTVRNFDNDTYVIHLKPYSWNIESKEKHLVDLTLRIYFKWEKDKIKIGYIGKHL